MEAGGGQGQGPSSRARVSRDARRCRFRRSIRCNAEVHFAVRPGGPVDGSAQGPCLLCLCHQLSDRYRPRGDCRCRSHARHSPGRSGRGSHHARTDGGSLRLEAGLSYRRQRLRFGREPGAARQTLVKQKKITPHIPVFDKSTRTDGTFPRVDFTFDPERDRYTCPAGKELVQFRRTSATPRTGITAEGTRLYRASKRDCDVCDLKSRCCPNAAARKIPRDLNENARDVARALASTPEYEAACRRRKKVEMLFAHLKRILRVGRLRLRGPCGAKDEFLLAATAQNLRRLARLRPASARMEIMAA
jgi:hypothetical protein